MHQILRKFSIIALLLISGCRMPVHIDGAGVIFAEQTGKVHGPGYVFEINRDFNEIFWPIPAPGHQFEGWGNICSTSYGRCELSLTEELWGQDRDVPLSARYESGYAGPLRLYYYDISWSSTDRTLRVPASSVALEGVHPRDNPRLFMASTDLALIIPGTRVGPEYRFPVPTNTGYNYQDLWLFVSGTDSNGVIASAAIDFGVSERVEASALRAHSQYSPWRDVLPRCAAASNPFALCTLEVLPFLGATTQAPEIKDILQRTVVSHPWMGKRFGEVLRRLPPHLLTLFRGITAVVIDANIRPSFYTTATGAIYLDPQSLWLTPTERETVDWEPDYRSDFGSALGFLSADLYVAGNSPAWQPAWFYPEDESRQLDDILWPIANLLIHELAHANDAMPPALQSQVVQTDTPLNATFRLERRSASFLLQATYPLRSSLLYQLGAVLFQGAPTNLLIRSLTPSEVGLEFGADDASALYAYASVYEDTAMLVEEVLTRHYFGLDRVVSFLDVPALEDAPCTDYTVRWGVRNRAGNAAVKERARLVLAGILGEDNVSTYLSSMPDTENIVRGIGLCESLPLLSAQQQATPGQYISAPLLARQQATRVRKHQQVRSLVQRGRARKDLR